MRRILGLIAVLALVVAFAMPVVTADAASHEKAANPCAAKEKMKKEGEKAMDKAKGANPCNPCAKKAMDKAKDKK